MGINFKKNIFTGLPVSFNAASCKEDIVFVSDFFVEDLVGGAEITTQVLINELKVKNSNLSIKKLRCSELTNEFIKNNKDKTWIFGNFMFLDKHQIRTIIESVNKYFVIEYDFKYCIARSTVKHNLQFKEQCDCHSRPQGQSILNFFLNARKVFFMSVEQKNRYQKLFPSFQEKNNAYVIGSQFDDETLNLLELLRVQRKEPTEEVFAVLGSNNWIKGTEDGVKWCQQHNKKFNVIGNLPYSQFLFELSKFSGLVYLPRDADTAPRVTIEAKLMGLDLLVNPNVLQKDEEWFISYNVEQTRDFLRKKRQEFWREVLVDSNENVVNKQEKFFVVNSLSEL